MEPGGRLLSIGAFARLTGISVSALRHYHDVGLLSPRDIDDRTGYRRYSSSQASTARAIRTLRAIDMPIEEIGAVLEAGPDAAREALRGHRLRLTDRAEDLSRQLQATDDLIERGALVSTTLGVRLMEVTLRVPDIDAAADFYRTVFDLEFEEEIHAGGPRHLHACGGSWEPEGFFLFTIWPAEEANPATVSSLGLTVQDVDTTYRRALGAGATGRSEPADSPDMPRNASFTDPSGNAVMVYQSW